MTNPQQSALHPAGPDAEVIAQLAWVLTGGAAVVFLGVMVLCALGLRGRRVVHVRWWLWGGGIALPVLVLSALLAFSTLRSAQLSEVSSRQAIKVAVVARLWWWEVRYTDPAGGPDIVLANEIRLPVGQPVYLGLSSADVIHSFWVPALAGKVDMVPGRVHGLTLRADRAGVYRAQCAEYCGEQHARMALHVVAQSEQEFAAWLAAQAKPARIGGNMVNADAADTMAGTEAAGAASGDRTAASADAGESAWVAAGRRAFEQQRCGACHVVRGVSEGVAGRPAGEGGMGPDLTHVGSRLYIGAGTLRNDRGALAAWIANPHGFKPGVRMPASADMDGATLQALATYLERLK